MRYELLSPDQWIAIFNQLNRNVVITGGEPLLYSGLDHVVLGIHPKLDIQIYSNLKVPLKGDLSWLQRRGLSLYLSYHPQSGDDRIFINNLNYLKKYNTKFTIHAIDVMGKEELAKLCRDRLGDYAKNVTIDADQRVLFEASSSKMFRKKVRCQRTNILIAPDGFRYHCVSRLLRRVQPFENLLYEPFSGANREVKCFDYGHCAPCDGLGEYSQRIIQERE